MLFNDGNNIDSFLAGTLNMPDIRAIAPEIAALYDR